MRLIDRRGAIASRRARSLAGALLLLPLVASCAAKQESRSTSAPAHATQPGMPCTQATRVARGALLKMGYTVASAEAPAAGRPGKVVGNKTTGWSAVDPQAGEVHTATVAITCSDSGAEFEAVTDEPWLGKMAFRRDFPSIVAELAEKKKAIRPGIDDVPHSGLNVTVEPIGGRDSVGEFGVDLTGVGITPVRVRIENRTERAYLFRGTKVRLVTESGSRKKPLPAAKVTPALIPPGDRQLAKTLIADGEIKPGEVRTGFLFFPSSAYKRASVTLIDRETDETEGLSIEF